MLAELDTEEPKVKSKRLFCPTLIVQVTLVILLVFLELVCRPVRFLPTALLTPADVTKLRSEALWGLGRAKR